MRDAKEWERGSTEDLEDHEGPAGRRFGRRGRTLAIGIAAAAVGALALVPPLDLLGALGDHRDGDAAPTPAGTAPLRPSVTDRPAGAPEPSEPVETAPTSGLDLDEQRATWRVTGGTEEAAALAVLVARRSARAGTAEPFVVLEAVERPAGDAVVVTVLIDDGIGAPERLAVPIGLGPDGARLAGEPWRLPGPDTSVLEPETSPITEERLLEAARRSLEHVGLPATDVSLARTTSWPVVATARDTDGTMASVWLRWHLDRFVVAGLPLDRSTNVGTADEVRP